MRIVLVTTFLSATTLWAQDLDAGAPPPGEAAPTSPAAHVEVAPAPAAEKPQPAATFKARFGEGVTFQSGDFSLNLRGRVQVQALALVPTAGSTATRQNALMVRRARLNLKGTAPHHLSYTLQLAFANQDMEADAPNVLRDFYVDWRPLRDLALRVGQTKVPFDVQRVISSSSLQLVDRSTVVAEFNLDRDVGLVAYSEDLLGLNQRLRYFVGVFGGDGRNRIGTDVGLLYVARIRLSLFGPFDDKLEGDPERSDAPRVALGAAVAHNVSTNRPRSTTGTPYQAARFDYDHVTADLHAKWKGLSLLGEYFWRQASVDSRTATVKGASVTEFSRSGQGFFVQAGGYVTSWLELVARYGVMSPTATTDPGFHAQREIGGGVNLMFENPHNLKLQTDYFWLDDGKGGNGRHQLRVQFQLYF